MTSERSLGGDTNGTLSTCGILGSIEPQLISWDPMSCDMWFGQAAYIYLNLERGIEVARVLAEWSEARAFVGDSSSSK